MGNLTLRSSYRAHLSTYFWLVVWAAAFYGLNQWLAYYLLNNDWGPFDNREVFVPAGYWVSWVAFGVIVLSFLYYVIYSPLRSYGFVGGGKGWERGTVVTYSFPFSKNVEEVFFDRIVSVEVFQSSIDRIFDTGTLNLKLVVFTNGEAKEVEWSVVAIENPFNIKSKILAGSPKHEGVDVNVRQFTPATA